MAHPDYPAGTRNRLSAPGSEALIEQISPMQERFDMKPTTYEDIGYGWSPDEEPKAPIARPSLPASIDEAEDHEPTTDQLFLADALSKVAPKGRISEVGIVQLNRRYGVSVVTESLRMAHGFGKDIHSSYAYVDKLCREHK